MQRRYAILDVFTDRPLAGNPLAVVRDSEGLGDAAMQAIAREFNLSETVFVSAAANPVHAAAIRIFTPASELPFAGHPTVGTAVLLGREAAADNRGKHEMVLVLEEKVGPIRCGVTVDGPSRGYAVFDVPRPATEVGEPGSVVAIASALGLAPHEIGFENHEPSVFSAGVPFAFVPVRDLTVIGRARPVDASWRSAFGETLIGAFLYCRETETTGHHFHARMFAPRFGVTEDPATGSAAAAFVGVVRRFDALPAGSHHLVIEQGFEMSRPSLIGLEIDIDGGKVVASRIGGNAVIVAEGTLDID
jgi:trans-2,3-dihydro-3-hydroxyanthranilate isomerase